MGFALALVVVDHGVQLLGDQVGLLEGQPTLAVEQGHQSGFANVFDVDLGTAFVGGDGTGSLVHYDVAAEAVDLVLGADVGNEVEDVLGHGDLGKKGTAAEEAAAFFGFGVVPLGNEGMGFGLEGDAAADDLAAVGGFKGAVDFNGQPETVQKLRAQVAFLGIHGADEDEFGGVADGDTLAFHVVASHGGGVEEDIDQMVVEEVNLVDIEDSPVGGGDQAGLETLGAGLDGGLDIQGTDQAVLGGADGKVNDADLMVGGLGHSGLSVTVLAEALAEVRWAAIGATLDHGNLGKEGGEGADGGGLGGAFFTSDKDAADLRVDGIEQEGPFHGLLPDDGGEGEPGFPLGFRLHQVDLPGNQSCGVGWPEGLDAALVVADVTGDGQAGADPEKQVGDEGKGPEQDHQRLRDPLRDSVRVPGD